MLTQMKGDSVKVLACRHVHTHGLSPSLSLSLSLSLLNLLSKRLTSWMVSARTPQDSSFSAMKIERRKSACKKATRRVKIGCRKSACKRATERTPGCCGAGRTEFGESHVDGAVMVNKQNVTHIHTPHTHTHAHAHTATHTRTHAHTQCRTWNLS